MAKYTMTDEQAQLLNDLKDVILKNALSMPETIGCLSILIHNAHVIVMKSQELEFKKKKKGK
jgi:hypothetical protein